MWEPESSHLVGVEAPEPYRRGVRRRRISKARALRALLGVVVSIPGPMLLGPGATAQSPAPATPAVRLPFPQEDGTLTPYTFELGYPLMTLVYDTLLARDEHGAPQPWLAHSVEASPDARRFTIRLVPGALWHDGRPVTAADVAFTFRFVADRPHARFTAALRGIDKVDTPDPSTVVVTLRQPGPGFSDQPLADLPILPLHLWQGLPRGRPAPAGLPVGSGPYRLVEHRPGEGYRFEANVGHFRGPPAVRTIAVPIMTSAEETFRALEQRQVDMIPASLDRDLGARVAQGTGNSIKEGPSYLGTTLLFNLRRPPFDRPPARQAVARALDLVRLARAVGDADPASRGYLHPESPWAAREHPDVFDEARARAEVAGVGLPPLQVLAPDQDPVKMQAARQVVLALRRVGLQADERPIPRVELSRALGEDGSVPTFSVAIGTTPPLASYDPDFLRRLFGSDPDATLNVTGYRSQPFDQLAHRVATTADHAARRAAVAEMLGLLARDAPAVPLFFARGAFVFRPAVFNGWVFVKGTGILDRRSFLQPGRQPSPAVPRAATEDSEDTQGPPYGYMALALVAVAAVLTAIGVFRARPSA